MTAFALSLALLVGLTLGGFGAGGALLTVPILVYIAGIDPHTAVRTSLVASLLTSAVAAFTQVRAGNVRIRLALSFGAAGLPGA
jgi:uncharacterized membrane protein YfcA